MSSKKRGRLGRISAALLAGAGVIGFLLLAAGCGEQSSAAPTAETAGDTGGRLQVVAETSYDFGNIPVDQKVEHKFKLKNSGTGPLYLGQLTVKRLQGC